MKKTSPVKQIIAIVVATTMSASMAIAQGQGGGGGRGGNNGGGGNNNDGGGGQNDGGGGNNNNNGNRRNQPAPVPGPDRGANNPPQDSPPTMNGNGLGFPMGFRSFSGLGNNQNTTNWGSANILQLRLTPAAYADGAEEPAGENRPSARIVSNAICAQSNSETNRRNATDFLWQWGQFLDHDIDETPTAEPAEEFPITVPADDRLFDPSGTGEELIPLDRSAYEIVGGVRQQVNLISAFIDGSNVYGSDEDRANALRTFDGTGRLKISEGNFLPFNTEGFDNAGGTGPNLFLAGDVRANEQTGLLAMHTLFMREHNHWVETLALAAPGLTGDELYQTARAIVGAEMQVITYRDFLPLLLGQAIAPYRGYNPNVDPGIANVFSTAAYRVGHTMLSGELQRVSANGSTAPEGNLALRDAFFRPTQITENDIDSVMRGLASQRCQEIDTQLVDDVRNFLFGPPGSGGFDLGALNIQRARDHGLADYNTARISYGLAPIRNFDEITSDSDIATALEEVYGSVDDIDPWVGMLAEDHVTGAMVGETLQRIMADQFTRLRDGDRFFYRNHLSDELIGMVEAESLATIIRRNTGVGNELPNNVFVR